MKHRDVWLAVLVCVNVVLLTGMVVVGAPPRAASAQAAGLAGNYLAVAGQIQSEFDAIYLLDLRERALHVFFFQKGSHNLEYGGFRDLERDFHGSP